MFFFLNNTAPPDIYTLSLHDALPISQDVHLGLVVRARRRADIQRVLLSRLVREQLTSAGRQRSEEHTSELQSQSNLVCRLLLEKKKNTKNNTLLITTQINITYNCTTP